MQLPPPGVLRNQFAYPQLQKVAWLRTIAHTGSSAPQMHRQDEGGAKASNPLPTPGFSVREHA